MVCALHGAESANSLPPPKTMCAWSATSLGATRGSIRAIPVVERHGMRQKAAALPARASAVTVVKVFMLLLSRLALMVGDAVVERLRSVDDEAADDALRCRRSGVWKRERSR